MFGGGARVLIERGLAYHGVRPAAPDVERMQQRFLAHYEDHLADKSVPYPDAADVLEVLVAQKANLIVVTNKFERFSVKLLAALGLAKYFAVIAGPDTFNLRKPDPGHLLRAVEKAGRCCCRHGHGGRLCRRCCDRSRGKRPGDRGLIWIPERWREELGADRLIDRLSDVPAVAMALLERGGR